MRVHCAREAVLGLALAALVQATPCLAQDPSTYYTVMHPGEFTIDWKSFYARGDRLTSDTRAALPNRLGLAYGTDPKQKLDVYQPATKTTAAPIFIFLHGGGMREGDRAQYGWIARPFARHGIVTIVASYRLTPAFRYPAQPEDVRQMLAWAYRHAREYGADPNRIYIGGHSAGAILSAFVAVDRDWQKALSLPADVVKGFVPVSGSYDLTAPDTVSEYVPDTARRAEASALLNVDPSPPPAIVAVGSPERQVAPSKAFAEALRKRGGDVELLVLDGMEHDQTALAVGDERSVLCQAMLKMMTGGAMTPSTRTKGDR